MKAQYIEAVSREGARYPTVFLGGGITNCPDWQQEIVSLLGDQLITIYNPRRKNFPIDDPNASQEQITWEFAVLNRSLIFSMWFSGVDSDQPICMYELGRNVALRGDKLDTVVIGVEKGYKRSQDVYIQLGLIDPIIPMRISTNLNDHATNIMSAMKTVLSRGLWDH